MTTTTRRRRTTYPALKWSPEDKFRWASHAGADPEVSNEDTFGTQTGRCRGVGELNCGMTYRIQDEEPGSADGHRERDWSLFSVARDGHMRRLECRTSVGIVYSQAVKDHNALHAAD
jgi:hypothetical protein